ncbi:MAG: bifunctional adenosylcobinamide kinase/adenosylcobinamide-phosphate guanylyltransferase [Nocardioidaceae bacterium]
MDVTLLGTGSADGWPNPFCGCASCRAARVSGEIRAQTSALVDGRILLDCGSETPRQALRAGVDLTGLGAVLVTHAHPDHLDPSMLLYRSWATDTPLEIFGPRPVVDACSQWVGNGSNVTLTVVKPGQRIDLRGYSVRVLPARHGGNDEAVLYDVQAPDGKRLLYATDTGPLQGDDIAAMSGAHYDYVLLEETFGDQAVLRGDHLNLTTFAQTVQAMRAVGAIDRGTDVVAVHLGHHNPPTPELARRLMAFGARVVPDGTALSRQRAVAQPVPPRRTLVTGGARSGKSHEAERLLSAHRNVVYVATSGQHPGDADWERRVARHRQRRPETWETRETLDLVRVLSKPGPPVLIDCLTLWLTRALDLLGAWEDGADLDRVERDLEEEFQRVAEAFRTTSRTLVAVTNEVGSGIHPETPAGRRFRDLLGRLNTMIAAECDQVLWCVAGRIVTL